MKLEESISKLLSLKFFELRRQLKTLTMEDLVNYLQNVVLKNINVRSLNEVSYYIMNVRINMIIEYLNINAILDKSNSIEEDLEDILRG